MLIACNRTNLNKHAKALLGAEYTEIARKSLISECLSGFSRSHGHISHDRAGHISRIDRILNNHGAEGFLEGKQDVHYSNTGDSYGLTILYVNGKLMIGDWGSLFDS